MQDIVGENKAEKELARENEIPLKQKKVNKEENVNPIRKQGPRQPQKCDIFSSGI